MYAADPNIRARDARFRIETWRTFLSNILNSDSHFSNEVVCELLGSASVVAMAEVESFMRDLVESIIYTINNSNHPLNLLQPQLHALHAHQKFDSLRKMETQNSSFWQYRLDITQYHLSQEIAKLPEPSYKHPQPPLKGNTIRLRDIQEVGEILCFPHNTSSIIELNQRTALTKLALYRNQFAHAVVTPTEIFPNAEREVGNIMEYLRAIADMLDVLATEWQEVIDKDTFLM